MTFVALYLVLTVLFIMFRVMPGDPTAHMVDPRFDESLREQILARHGLDRPLHEQYLVYIANFLQGDLGHSFTHGTAVFPFLIDRAINTLVITLPAVVLAFSIGPILGTIFAWRRGEKIDVFATGGLMATYAAPAFWVGMILIMIFSFQLGFLPSGGMRAGDYRGGTYFDQFVSWEFVRHATLPFLVYFIWQVSRPALQMRNNMLDVLDKDFIQMHRAQGLSDRSIMFRHAGRNSVLPVMHYAAVALGFAVGGSVVIESVFSWPGLGQAMWQAVLEADYPVAQGAFFMLSAIIIFMNFIADVLSTFIDPRVAEEEVIE